MLPLEDLDVILESKTRRVLMPRAEYEALRRRAKREEELRPPLKAALTSAEYRVKVEEERAVIRGTLELDVVREGLHVLPLEMSGIGLLSATLDDAGAQLGRLPGKTPELFVEGIGRHRLLIEATTPLQTTAARQILDFRLPTPPSTRLHVTVPGDVEIRDGAAVIERVFDEAAQETRMELLAGDARMTLVMTLNSRLKRRERVVMARSVVVDEVTEAYECLHATVSLDVLHRAVRDFQFVVPEGFEITTVESPALSSWLIRDDGDRRILDVRLRDDTTGAVVLSVAAVRSSPDLENWALAKLEPLDVVGHVAVAGLLLEERLKAHDMTAAGLIPIDRGILLRALPKSVVQPDAGEVTVRPLVVYYAPQSDFSLSARFARQPARLTVTTSMLLTLADSGLSVNGGFALRAAEEDLFEFDFLAPADWRIDAVTGHDGKPQPFERHAGQDGKDRIRVRLPSPIADGEERSVYFTALREPSGWFDPWETRELEFPQFAAQGALRDIGAIAVDVRNDLRARPVALEALTPLDANEKARYGLTASAAALAYRYESHPYAATLSLERKTPRLTAETYSFFRVERDQVVTHCELVYEVSLARARRVRLSLPAGTPELLSIRGLQGTQLKEFAREPGDAERVFWNVSLADARSDTIHLAVDFQMPVAATNELALPLVRAEDVAYQSGFLAVEGSAELDVSVVEHPRPVDIGELTEAEYQPGRRLLGAYGFVGAPPEVRLEIKGRGAYQLPSAIVKRAELTTRFSSDGASQSTVVFHLRTKASYVDLELPPGSILWSALLNGKPASPQQKGDRVLLGLPAGQLDARLQFVYETPVNSIAMFDTFDVVAPRLFLGSEDGGRREVPVADLRWYVDTPTGFEVVSSAGTVVSDQIRPTLPAAVTLAQWLYRISGGISMRRGLVGGCVRLFGATAVSARKAAVGWESDSYEYAEGRPMAQRAAAGSAVTGIAPVDDAPMPAETEEAAPVLPGIAAPSRPRPPRRKPVKKGKAALWSIEGARSLTIGQYTSGRGIVFRSLGDVPRLVVSLVSRRRLESLAWATGLFVFLFGTVLTRAARSRRATLVVAILLVSTVLPAIPGLQGLALVLNAAFYAACALIPYYGVAGLVRRIATRPRRADVRGRAVGAVSAAVVFALLAAWPGLAGGAPAKGERMVVEVEPAQPVSVPDGAVIVPYSEDDGEPDRIMVPYDRFVELWRLAQPVTNRVAAPPVSYSLAGAAYTATLAEGDALVLRAEAQLVVHAEGVVAVPLPLAGAVLEHAEIDGAPARVGSAPAPVSPRTNAKKGKPSIAPPVCMLHVAGKGRHKLNLAVRVKLTRQGGWRVAQATLPVAPATSLELKVPRAETEVVFAGIADRLSYRADADNQTIRTALGADGRLDLRWRPRISEGDVDRTLTAESTATFDIQEDHLRMEWSLSLAFRRGEYEQFDVLLPEGYLVERVTGTNVRGWQVADANNGKRLTVALLQRAKEQESFVVHAWRPGRVAKGGAEQIAVPSLGVANAIRQTGRITIRRSPLLDVRTVAVAGARRVDVALPSQPGVAADERSPLGMRPYQSYEFVALPFELGLVAETSPVQQRASVQSILRMAERERSIESRFKLSVRGRPVFGSRLRVPPDLEVTDVAAPGTFEWAETRSGGDHFVTLYFATGLTGDIPIVLRGRLGETRELMELAIPRLEVVGVKEQPGHIVVQADPAFDVQARELEGIDSVLLRRVHGWLQPVQRQFARLALHYRNPDYAGRLVLVPRKPEVTGYTVSNVRVTDRAIEETVMIDFRVRNAGVRRVEFSLPAALADARISVPLLRRKRVLPVEGEDRVRVVLELQNEVMNQLRVLVESDRLLTGDAHTVSLPRIVTGRTDRRYVAIESAGRDEVVVESMTGLEGMNREQKEWARVATLFRGGTTDAYLADPDVESPSLAFRTQQRKAVTTAGARIGLARTLVIVDPRGTYRAAQSYRVDNRTEQFLEIVLPTGAALWTARVAGEYVKPVVPDGNHGGRVRIPLVKTAAGDLDYEVALKYGGRLDGLRHIARVGFPLIRTENINVELSQVELRLPRSHKWLDFDGTMRMVQQAGDFEAGFLSYQNKLTERLVNTLKYGNYFEQARSVSNLKGLAKSLESTQKKMQTYGNNAKVNIEISNASAVIQDANKELAEFDREQQQDMDGLDNRGNLNDAFVDQDNHFARNVVFNNGANWDNSTVAQAGGLTTSGVFNGAWLAGNSLAVVDQKALDASGRIQVQSGQQFDNFAINAQPRQAAPQGQMEQQTVYYNQMPANLPDGQQTLVQQRGGQMKNRGRRSQKELAQRYQYKLEQQGQRQQELTVQQLGTLQDGGAVQMDQLWVAPPGPGQAPQPVANEGIVQVLGGDDEGGGIGGGGVAAWQEAATGLASLDIELPGDDASRWTTYRFSTPRGEIDIRAVAVTHASLDGCLRGGLALGLLALAGVVRVVGRGSGERRRGQRRATGTVLIVAGALGVFVGVLPIAGVVAVVVGIVMRRLAR